MDQAKTDQQAITASRGEDRLAALACTVRSCAQTILRMADLLGETPLTPEQVAHLACLRAAGAEALVAAGKAAGPPGDPPGPRPGGELPPRLTVPSDPRPAPVPENKPDTARILLLDEPSGQGAVERRLAGIPHELVTTTDADEAEKLFHEGRFHLVLGAVGARDAARRSALRRMRAWEAANRTGITPIVALTTQAAAGDDNWSSGDRCWDMRLVKPIRKNELLEAVRHYVWGEEWPHSAGVPDAIRALAPRYLEMQRQALRSLREPVRRMEAGPVREFAQGLTGMAADLGLSPLGMLGARLAAASAQENWGLMRRRLAEISRYMENAEARCA